MTAPVAEASTSAVDAQSYKSVFRRHPSGVAIVTLDGPQGPVGFTAASLISLSLNPPLVAVAVAETASVWPALRTAGSIVVHLLGANQQGLAQRFATSGVDRFAVPTRWGRLHTGEPYLIDAPAHLRASVTDRVPLGDHHLVVGVVIDASVTRDAAPLVYHDGAFHTLAGADHSKTPGRAA